MKQVMFEKTGFLILALILGFTASQSVFAQQFARPSSDVAPGPQWEASSGKSDPLWPMLDETSPNDLTDYIDSNKAAGTAELGLSSVTDPSLSTGHIISFRATRTGANNSTGELQLWQGGIQIATTGALSIATTDVWESFSYTLSAAEANAITDYSALSFRIISAVVSNNNQLLVTWMELEVPTATASAPTVDTPTFSAVTDTTATLGGTVASDGGATITERGTVWGTAPNPTILTQPANVNIVAGTTGTFTGPVTGLPPSTPIFFAAYATNSVDTSYSADGSFTTDAPTVPPVVGNPTFSTVLSNGATLGVDGVTGTVTDKGTAWKITAGVIETDNQLSFGSGPGAFSHAHAGMLSADQIFFKAYATNTGGTTLSAEDSFYTYPLNDPTIGAFSGVDASNITINWTNSTETGDAGGSIVIVSEVSSSITAPADGTDYTGTDAAYPFSESTSGDDFVVYKGTGTSITLTGLPASTQFWVEIYSYSGTGSGVTGVRYKTGTPATDTASTTAGGSLPTLTATPTFTTVLSNGATLGGTVLTAGSPAADQQGTVWNHTGVTPVTENPLDQGAPTLTVPFTDSRTGMNSADQVFFSAFARQSTTYTYSDVASFYTYPVADPAIGSFSGVDDSNITINWTNSTETGDAGGSIVVVSEVSSSITAPADGTDYTGTDAAYPFSESTSGDDFVVYKGTGTSITITGLPASTQFWVAIYSYSGTGSGVTGVRYKIGTPATGTTSTTVAPTLPTLTATPTFTAVLSNGATLGGTVLTAGSPVADQQGTVWNTTGAPVTQNALDQGAPTLTVPFTQSRTGMLSADQIFFSAFARQSTTYTYSNVASFYTYPANQASTVIFSNIGASSMTINWTPTAEARESGSIVVVSTVDNTITAPVDGTVYTVSATAPFGDPTVGAGNDFVVYKSTGTSVTISGLTENTRYYVAVYSYSGSGSGPSGVRYLTATPATGDEIAVAASDEPTVQASNIVIKTVASKALRFSWTPGNGVGSLVTVRDNGVSAVPPTDTTDYAADSDYSAAPPPPITGTGNFVVYKGTGKSVIVNGLTAGNTYIITVYAWGGSAVSPDYLPLIDTTPISGNEVSQVTDGPAMHNYNNAADCTDCHSNHGGAGLVPRDANAEAVCVTCHNVDSPTSASTKLNFSLHLTPSYGNVDPDCGSCHELHNPNDNTTSTHPITSNVAENLKYIRSNVDKYISQATPDDAVYQVTPDDLAIEDGTSITARGICQSCHVNVGNHRHDGTGDQCHDGSGGNCGPAETACLACHTHLGKFAPSGGGCTSCHNTAQDKDGVGGNPGRRIIVSEFSRLSSHVDPGSLQDSDCEVCHAQDTATPGDTHDHIHGLLAGADTQVTLYDADDKTTLYQLSAYADPRTNAAQAAVLTTFCLSCHDSDGAVEEGGDALTPFTGSGAPPNIAATWPSASHATITSSHLGNPVSCFGDGQFGCHGSGHGGEKLTLLAPADTAATSPDFSEQREGFCLNCHDSDGTSDIDIDQWFTGLATDVQYTAGSNYTKVNQKHDVLPADQTYSGAVITCKNCHSPHLDNNSRPVANPDTGAALKVYSRDSSYSGDATGFAYAWDANDYDPTNPEGGTSIPEPDYVEFCLVCHDGTAPAGVTLPAGASMLNMADTYRVDDQHGRLEGGGSASRGYMKMPWANSTNYNAGNQPTQVYSALNCTLCHGAHGSGNIYNLRTSITVNGTVMTVGGKDAFKDPALCTRNCGGTNINDELPEFGSATYVLPAQEENGWGAWCTFCHEPSHGTSDGTGCQSGHIHGGGNF